MSLAEMPIKRPIDFRLCQNTTDSHPLLEVAHLLPCYYYVVHTLTMILSLTSKQDARVRLKDQWQETLEKMLVFKWVYEEEWRKSSGGTHFTFQQADME